MTLEGDLVARLREPPYSSLQMSKQMARDIERAIQQESSTDPQPLVEQPCQLDTHADSLDGAPVEVTDRQVSASTKVLAIPELILHILSFVSPFPDRAPEDGFRPFKEEDPRSVEVQLYATSLRALSHAQRVNRTWRSLINTSKLLQQNLFLAPHTTSAASWEIKDFGPQAFRPILNPLIQAVTDWRVNGFWCSAGGRICIIASMNIERKDIEHLLAFLLTQKRMLLSQPPVLDAALVYSQNDSVKYTRFGDDGGITFETLLDNIQRMFAMHTELGSIEVTTLSFSRQCV